MARDFNGSTDRLDWSSIGNLTGSPITISAWVYSDGPAGNADYILCLHRTGDTAFGLAFSIPSPTAMNFYRVGNTSINVIGGVANSWAGWLHFLVTHDGTFTDATKVHIYRNGTELEYGTQQNGVTEATINGSLSLGGRIFDDARNFDGKLAEVGVWDRVLSAGEIAALAAGTEPDIYPTDLLFYYSGRTDTTTAEVGGAVATADGTSYNAAHPQMVNALTAIGITTGASTLDAPTLGIEGGDTDDLTATNIVTGAPTLGAPTIGQVHALTSAGITTAAPTLGAPTLGIVYVIDDLILEWVDAVYDLTANGITTAAPTLGAPTLGQTHALIAAGITTSAPTLGAPVISQTHVLTAAGITTAAPTLDAPTLGQVHALTANGITTGAPELGAPSMAGEAALTANGITTGSPTLDAPTIGQVHALAANSISTSAPTLDAATLGQVHVLIANGVTTPAPIFGAPSFGQAHVLAANGITTGAPTLGAPEEIVPVTDWLYIALTDTLVGDVALTDTAVWTVVLTDAQAL